MQKVMVVISLVLIMLGLGCTAMSRYVTYAEIDRDAVEYAVDTGVADVNDYDDWWTNIVMVERLKSDVDSGHKIIQLNLKQLIQKDDLEYSIHKDVVATDLAIGLQREKLLFGETGLLSLGLSMVGFGGLTGLLGLMRKRPKDWTPEEVESTLVQVKGEVTEKDKQVLELVRGVQRFLDTSDEETGTKLKTYLAMSQSSTTRETVAKMKAST